MAVAGIDVGTTGCKCTIYNDEGQQLSEAYEEYPSAHTEGRERDPSVVWQNVKKVLHDSAADAGETVEAIGVASFGETFVMLDERDRPVTNTVLYTDWRGEEQCKILSFRMGTEKIMEITALNPSSNFSIPKLMWTKEYKPEEYRKAKKILLYADYIIYMLTGETKIDYSLASRTMAFDLKKRAWSREIFEAAEIDLEKMPDIVPTGTPVGKIRRKIAKETGISPDAIVCAGCHDQIAAAVGTGTFSTDTAVNGAGTVECITPLFHSVKSPEVMLEGNYCTVPYVMPDTYVTYAYSNTGGALLKWYRDKIACMEAAEAKKKGLSPYEAFNEQLSDGASGLLVLPYFAGAATPYMDTEVKGAILGLTLETTSLDIYKALMEATAYEDRLNMERIKAAGISFQSLCSCGGGARSSYWVQLKADVLNLPIESLGSIQAGTLGTVMMAGVGCGIYKNLEEASSVFRKPGIWYEPDKKKHDIYMEKYEQYKKIYHAVKAVMQ